MRSGALKKAANGVLGPLSCSRIFHVRSARQRTCGLAGRAFLNVLPCFESDVLCGLS